MKQKGMPHELLFTNPKLPRKKKKARKLYLAKLKKAYHDKYSKYYLI